MTDIAERNSLLALGLVHSLTLVDRRSLLCGNTTIWIIWHLPEGWDGMIECLWVSNCSPKVIDQRTMI